MSTDEYVPSDEQVRGRYCDGTYAQTGHTTEGEDFDAWLARVRRDAARAVLVEFRRTELALIPPDADEDDPVRTRQQALAWRIEMHLLGNYPEETP